MKAPSTPTMSLRKQLFKFIESDKPTLKQTLKKFRTYNQVTVKRYYYSYKSDHKNDTLGDIYLTNLDTVKEAEIAVQQGDFKKVEALHKIHQMKLKPIVNREEKTLKEIFDAV